MAIHGSSVFQANNSTLTGTTNGATYNASVEYRLGGFSFSRVATVDGGTGHWGGGYNFDFNASSPRHDVTASAAGVGFSSTGVRFYAAASQTAGTSLNAAALLDTSGNLTLTATGGLGYSAGAGGTVTQATSKATAVTLNKITGEITLNAVALAAATIVSFTLNNSTIAATDLIAAVHHSGGTTGAYTINARATGAGTAVIDVRNNTAGSLSEALVIKFAVIRAVAA